MTARSSDDRSEKRPTEPLTARPMTARDMRLAQRMAERQARALEKAVDIPAPPPVSVSVPHHQIRPAAQTDQSPSVHTNVRKATTKTAEPYTQRQHVIRPNNPIIHEPPPSPHEIRRRKLEERRAEPPDGEFVVRMGIGQQLEQFRKLVLSQENR